MVVLVVWAAAVGRQRRRLERVAGSRRTARRHDCNGVGVGESGGGGGGGGGGGRRGEGHTNSQWRNRKKKQKNGEKAGAAPSTKAARGTRHGNRGRRCTQARKKKEHIPSTICRPIRR